MSSPALPNTIEARAQIAAERAWAKCPEINKRICNLTFERFLADALAHEREVEACQQIAERNGYCLTHAEADEIVRLESGTYSITRAGNDAYRAAGGRVQSIRAAAMRRAALALPLAAE